MIQSFEYDQEKLLKIIKKVQQFMDSQQMIGNFTYVVRESPDPITGLKEELIVTHGFTYEDWFRRDRSLENLLVDEIESLYDCFVSFDYRGLSLDCLTDRIKVVYKTELKKEGA